MTPRRAFATILVGPALTVAALVACDDPLGPGDVAGTYVLRSVRGNPVPALLSETDASELHVLADTLRLDPDGTGLEVSVLQRTGMYFFGPARTERPLGFRIWNGRLVGSYPCAPHENCAGTVRIEAEVTESGLRADVHPYGTGPLVFERVD